MEVGLMILFSVIAIGVFVGVGIGVIVGIGVGLLISVVIFEVGIFSSDLLRLLKVQDPKKLNINKIDVIKTIDRILKNYFEYFPKSRHAF